jgi:hypothetical protein
MPQFGSTSFRLGNLAIEHGKFGLSVIILSPHSRL